MSNQHQPYAVISTWLTQPNLITVLTAAVVVAAWRLDDILSNRHGRLAQPERP